MKRIPYHLRPVKITQNDYHWLLGAFLTSSDDMQQILHDIDVVADDLVETMPFRQDEPLNPDAILKSVIRYAFGNDLHEDGMTKQLHQLNAAMASDVYKDSSLVQTAFRNQIVHFHDNGICISSQTPVRFAHHPISSKPIINNGLLAETLIRDRTIALATEKNVAFLDVQKNLVRNPAYQPGYQRRTPGQAGPDLP